jgi:hypothetical protein
MEDATIVGGDIALVEEKAFLYCSKYQLVAICGLVYGIHLLKLFRGVDTSTWPVSRSGMAGKTTNRTSRRFAAMT